ncbi:type IX secretion system PorP/SprF family membrane protein [Pontibacter ummariensis]|uniref:Type IX secretion system membrane protein, PorP/SprF family n=1 Tax=Pontibacter ummariensis TaxID=1610492 RepID=A0A239CQK9_9BACT|nr:type IX secretion system membrane protein PorP/SprF [Pontibacter ummariensis]PRY14891.1 type IX secretion system PorP/SprF family membrane protein [Pontibacter ummariensis]SNS22199.1 type IX secretion system membrane protein, PorP/SprF family [Pontibacter ummariensis]
MNKSLILIIILLCFAITTQVRAQQRPQYSQYMLNGFLLNPAIAGIEDYADLRVGHRRQWVGLEGAPTTYYVSAHTPLNKGASGNKYHRALAHHGMGAILHTDETGPLRRTGLSVSYAYHLPITTKINVSAGVSTGLIRNSINASELEFGNDNDPLIGGGNIRNTMLDLNLGFWVYSRNFSVGVAGAQLLEDAGSLDEGITPDDEANLGLQRHYFATASYRFEPTEELDVIPSVMLKLASPSPASIDASMRVLYDERFWVGAGYRHKDALVGMVGVYVSPLLDVSYSYDYTLSDLNQVSAGTHEIVIGFKVLNNRRVICPQWVW